MKNTSITPRRDRGRVVGCLGLHFLLLDAHTLLNFPPFLRTDFEGCWWGLDHPRGGSGMRAQDGQRGRRALAGSRYRGANLHFDPQGGGQFLLKDV